ncbi:MAG: hypothetical protein WCF68_02990 [Terriglobales bacterium]
MSMITMNRKPLWIHTSGPGWIRRAWNSAWRVGAEGFTGQAGAQSYRASPGLILEPVRVRGKLVVMGRNQTMKMLIQAASHRASGQ